MNQRRMRIAVVGGGVAGIVASHLLQKEHDVVLFEKNDYVGGHTNTVRIEHGPDAGLAVDTGFIVLNDKTYPRMHQFLQSLDVPVRWSDMSFSYHCERTNLQYAGTDFNGLFAQRANLLNPKFLLFLAELAKFCRQAMRDKDADNLDSLTLGEYLKEGGYSDRLVNDYLFPMGSAIWSSPREEISSFPARTFIQFFANHGLLSVSNRPRWQTVIGGSQSYVQSFLERFRGEVRRSNSVTAITRDEQGVEIRTETRAPERFDAVVIAAHADQALAMLETPTADEQELLGCWRYENNHTILHTDEAVMPANRRAWASWNYIRTLDEKEGAPASLTYDMTRLQGLHSENRFFVTLNRAARIDPQKVVKEFWYTHPVYTLKSIHSQSALSSLQGKNNTYFCGSYFGYGFHEDAIKSGLDVAQCFQLSL